MNKFILFITKLLMKWCQWRGKVLKITGTSGPKDVYLIRYYVVRSKYVNFFIHQFLRSDRDDLHDHPWDFVTYLVRGSYTERKYNQKTGKIKSTLRINKARVRKNTFVYRKATDQHQVITPKELKEHQKNQAPLTICITGRVKREWGFIVESKRAVVNGRNKLASRTWIPWRKYLNVPENEDRG